VSSSGQALVTNSRRLCHLQGIQRQGRRDGGPRGFDTTAARHPLSAQAGLQRTITWPQNLVAVV